MRVAVLSTAHVHAESYLSILSAREDVDAVLWDDDAPDRGRETARRHGVPFVDRDGLARFAPQAVVVTSENIRHRRDAERAAALGAHILCEKPLATTREDGRAILDVTGRAGVGLMTAYPVHFAPEVVALRAALAAGELGLPLGAIGTNTGSLPTERHWFADPVMSGGGALVDHVVHLAEILDASGFGAAGRVTAVGNGILSGDRVAAGVETGALLTVAYDGGAVVTIDCSWSVPAAEPLWGGLRLEVVGTKGSIAIDPFAARLEGWQGSSAAPAYGPDLDALMLDAFLAAARGEAPFAPDGEAGMRTLEIVLAAQESLSTGRTVDLGRPRRAAP